MITPTSTPHLDASISLLPHVCFCPSTEVLHAAARVILQTQVPSPHSSALSPPMAPSLAEKNPRRPQGLSCFFSEPRDTGYFHLLFPQPGMFFPRCQRPVPSLPSGVCRKLAFTRRPLVYTPHSQHSHPSSCLALLHSTCFLLFVLML